MQWKDGRRQWKEKERELILLSFHRKRIGTLNTRESVCTLQYGCMEAAGRVIYIFSTCSLSPHCLSFPFQIFMTTLASRLQFCRTFRSYRIFNLLAPSDSDLLFYGPLFGIRNRNSDSTALNK